MSEAVVPADARERLQALIRPARLLSKLPPAQAKQSFSFNDF